MRNHRYVTVGSVHRNNKLVPLIRLSGSWLAENGFKTGRKVHIYVKPGSLTVNLILPEDEEEYRTQPLESWNSDL